MLQRFSGSGCLSQERLFAIRVQVAIGRFSESSRKVGDGGEAELDGTGAGHCEWRRMPGQ
jgi:hypothetical protein